MQNKPLSCKWSIPVCLLYDTKSRSVWQNAFYLKALSNLSLGQSLSTDVGVWSRLLEHSSFHSSQARVGDIEQGQW